MGRKYVFIILLALLGSACGSRRAAAPVASQRYERQPIREVTEEQLKADGQLIDALALLESGRNDEALAALGRLTAADAGNAAAWYEMSRLLMARGWTDSAAACIGRAVAAAPRNKWYLLHQAQVSARRGDANGMKAAWEKIVQLEPDRLEHYYDLSNACLAANDAQGAIRALDRVEQMVGPTEEVSLQKQRIWTAAGQPDKAERELVALADAMPHEKRYQAMTAEMMMSHKKYRKAKTYYDRVLALDPDDEYIHIQLAEYYKQTGQADDADREMGLAMDNPRLDCTTKVQLLAQFYTNEEFYTTRREATFGLLDRARRGCEGSPQFALVYGDVLMRQSRFAEAAPWLETSLQADSSHYAVWEALLICLTEVPEREADLLGYAARAERLFPMKTLPLYLQAIHAVQQGQHAEALDKLEKARKWGFSNGYLEAETYALLAECHYRTGSPAKAWDAFERCLAVRPDEMSVLNNYAYYLSEQGEQLDKAERMSRRTIEAEPDNANSLDTYGWILHLLGRDSEALPYLEKAVRLNPESDTLRRHLSEVRGH